MSEGVLLSSSAEAEGHVALERALSLGPDGILEELAGSELRGRDAAAFPLAAQWRLMRQRTGERTLVGTSSDGLPGAFKDGELLRRSPRRVVEGSLIAAHALGARRLFLIAGPGRSDEVEGLESAVAEARRAGVLDALDLASIRVSVGPGSGPVGMGNTSALLNALEGRRGSPRAEPPWPHPLNGFRGPVLVSNVETLAWLPPIISLGADWFRGVGRPAHRGPALFAVSGRVARPGVYEVPLGTSFRELIVERAGGPPDGAAVKVFLPGGLLSAALPASALDAPADFEGAAEAGSHLGPASVIVVDETACLVGFARSSLELAARQSCGKCVPCRLGTQVLASLAGRIAVGGGTTATLNTAAQLGRHLRATSLCGLGCHAADVLLSTLEGFGEEYREHLGGHCCYSCRT